jgi:hypothetical protein
MPRLPTAPLQQQQQLVTAMQRVQQQQLLWPLLTSQLSRRATRGVGC